MSLNIAIKNMTRSINNTKHILQLKHNILHNVAQHSNDKHNTNILSFCS
jgi:hypothetical protein